MRMFPLLSDAYGAALAAANRGKSRSKEDETRGLNPADAYPAGPIPPDDDDEDLEPTLPDDDDLETAPTRPLRLDRLHL